MELESIVEDVASALVVVDRSGIPFKTFQAGIGPYGEPQALRAVVAELSLLEPYQDRASVRRTPDVLVKDEWALEFKLLRPFGDNGKPAENWSTNLLHPYAGNTSLLGDCLKLREWTGSERRAVAAIGYTHCPEQISLEPVFRSFEVICEHVLGIALGGRVQTRRNNLVHPVPQELIVVAWEVR